METILQGGCCKCGNQVDSKHVMCDECFEELRTQSFSRLLRLSDEEKLPPTIRDLRNRLLADHSRVENDPAVEALRTKAGKFFLGEDFPSFYRYRE